MSKIELTEIFTKSHLLVFYFYLNHLAVTSHLAFS